MLLGRGRFGWQPDAKGCIEGRIVVEDTANRV